MSTDRPADSETIVSVPLADLMRVAPFKGRDDIRYYLNGVLVTPYQDHALLVATNGHWMGIYESEKAHVDKERLLDLPSWFIAQAENLQAFTASSPLDDDEWDADDTLPPASHAAKTLTIASEGGHLMIREPAGEVLVKPGKPFIDGKFPDWRKVLPDPATLERGIFSAIATVYLASLHKAVPDMREHALFCYHNRTDSEKPVVFRFGNMPELVVALMPRRDGDAEPKDWPQWMQPEAERKEQCA